MPHIQLLEYSKPVRPGVCPGGRPSILPGGLDVAKVSGELNSKK